jgi:hypothetical protein
VTGDAGLYDDVSKVLGEVRRAKSLNGWKTRTPVHVTIVAVPAVLARVREAEGDFRAAVTASTLTFREGEALEVHVEVAELVGGGAEPRA